MWYLNMWELVEIIENNREVLNIFNWMWIIICMYWKVYVYFFWIFCNKFVLNECGYSLWIYFLL